MGTDLHIPVGLGLSAPRTHAVHQVCICAEGFAGPKCDVPCPGPPGNRCFGHGLCRDSNAGDGSCVCAGGWYGAACTVHCRPETCFGGAATDPAPHAQCTAAGDCVCQRNATGQWAGALCNRCLEGYWGLRCDWPCACNGHGACDRLDGECRCFQDGARGHWAGTHCAECAPGFLEPYCRLPNVAITRVRDLAVLRKPQSPGAMVLDEARGLLYVGGAPLIVFNITTSLEVASVDLRGSLQSGVVRARSVVLLLADGGRLWTVHLQPGLPCLVQAVAADLPAPQLPVASRGRWLAPQSVGRPYHRVFTVRDAQYVVSFQSAVLTIFLLPQTAAVAPASVLRLTATALGLDTVRDTALWCPRTERYPCAHSDDVAAVLVAGAEGGRWQVIVVAMPPTGAFYALRGALALPQCARDALCRAVGCLALAGRSTAGTESGDRSPGGNATDVYLVLEGDHGLVVAKVALAPGAAPRVVLSVPCAGDGTHTSALAVVHDALTSALFLGTQPAGAPSVVHKLRDDSLQPYGYVRLGHRAGRPEVGHFLLHAPKRRRLYVLITVQTQPVVVTLLLAAVTALEPDLADTRGGTKIQVACLSSAPPPRPPSGA